MLRHVVIIRWQDGTSAEEVEEIAAAVRELPRSIPFLRAVVCGPDLGLAPDNNDFVTIVDVDDAQAWRDYQQHPAHVALGSRVAPLLARRTAVQFELPGA